MVITQRKAISAPDVDDIGVIYVFVMCLYATATPIYWALNNQVFTSPTDWRINELAIQEREIRMFVTVALAYIVGFLLTFRRARQNDLSRSRMSQRQKRIPDIILFAALSVAGLSFLGTTYIQLQQGVFSGSYIESYLAIQSLPLEVRQFVKFFHGIGAVAVIFVLVALLQRGPKTRVWIALWVVILALSANLEGSRASVLIPAFVLVIAWHSCVRPIPAPIVAALATGALAAFSVAGIAREISASQTVTLESIVHNFSLGEFNGVYMNAIEIHRAREQGLHVPEAALFGELTGPIPSQLLPFEKDTLSQWYVRTFYPDYAAAGGGMAFGALAQAAAGFGAVEALLRGIILGFLASLLMKLKLQAATKWWTLPVYIYFVSRIFQSVRDTSFSLLTDAVQYVCPAIVLILFVSRILPGRRAIRPR
jgi:hypothetical protein